MLFSPSLTSSLFFLWFPPAHPPMSAQMAFPQDNLSSSPNPLLYPVIDCVPLVTMMVLHLSLWCGNCVCLWLPFSPGVQQSPWNTGVQQPFAEWVSTNEHPPLWTSAGSKLVCSQFPTCLSSFAFTLSFSPSLSFLIAFVFLNQHLSILHPLSRDGWVRGAN